MEYPPSLTAAAEAMAVRKLWRTRWNNGMMKRKGDSRLRPSGYAAPRKSAGAAPIRRLCLRIRASLWFQAPHRLPPAEAHERAHGKGKLQREIVRRLWGLRRLEKVRVETFCMLSTVFYFYSLIL